VLVGWALILLIIRWALGGFLTTSGTLLVVMLIVGLLLSVPFALDVLRGREEPPPSPQPVYGEVHGVPHAPNSTYIVVSPPPRRQAFRVLEFGPIAFFFYTIFWRAPLGLGDWVLSGLWRLLARFRNEERIVYPPGGGDWYDDATLDQEDDTLQ
jgi:hypothetical protein